MKKRSFLIFSLLFFLIISLIPLSSFGENLNELVDVSDQGVGLDDIEYAIEIVYSIIDEYHEEIPVEKRIQLEKVLNGTKLYLDGYILTEDYKDLVGSNLGPKSNQIENIKLKNTLKNSIEKIADSSIEYKTQNNSAREDLDAISENRNSVYSDTQEVKISDAPLSKKILLTINKLIASFIVLILIYFTFTIS